MFGFGEGDDNKKELDILADTEQARQARQSLIAWAGFGGENNTKDTRKGRRSTITEQDIAKLEGINEAVLNAAEVMAPVAAKVVDLAAEGLKKSAPLAGLAAGMVAEQMTKELNKGEQEQQRDKGDLILDEATKAASRVHDNTIGKRPNRYARHESPLNKALEQASVKEDVGQALTKIAKGGLDYFGDKLTDLAEKSPIAGDDLKEASKAMQKGLSKYLDKRIDESEKGDLQKGIIEKFASDRNQVEQVIENIFDSDEYAAGMKALKEQQEKDPVIQAEKIAKFHKGLGQAAGFAIEVIAQAHGEEVLDAIGQGQGQEQEKDGKKKGGKKKDDKGDISTRIKEAAAKKAVETVTSTAKDMKEGIKDSEAKIDEGEVERISGLSKEERQQEMKEFIDLMSFSTDPSKEEYDKETSEKLDKLEEHEATGHVIKGAKETVGVLIDGIGSDNALGKFVASGVEKGFEGAIESHEEQTKEKIKEVKAKKAERDAKRSDEGKLEPIDEGDFEKALEEKKKEKKEKSKKGKSDDGKELEEAQKKIEGKQTRNKGAVQAGKWLVGTALEKAGLKQKDFEKDLDSIAGVFNTAADETAAKEKEKLKKEGKDKKGKKDKGGEEGKEGKEGKEGEKSSAVDKRLKEAAGDKGFTQEQLAVHLSKDEEARKQFLDDLNFFENKGEIEVGEKTTKAVLKAAKSAVKGHVDKGLKGYVDTAYDVVDRLANKVAKKELNEQLLTNQKVFENQYESDPKELFDVLDGNTSKPNKAGEFAAELMEKNNIKTDDFLDKISGKVDGISAKDDTRGIILDDMHDVLEQQRKNYKEKQKSGQEQNATDNIKKGQSSSDLSSSKEQGKESDGIKRSPSIREQLPEDALKDLDEAKGKIKNSKKSSAQEIESGGKNTGKGTTPPEDKSFIR